MPTLGQAPLPIAAMHCISAAATQYHVPQYILLAIAEKEAGKPGQWVRNTNGTSDVGAMQFNTAYLAELKHYGITPQSVSNPDCYAYQLAAWRLGRHLRYDRGDIWTRAANYHSRTPAINATYRSDLIVKSLRWSSWLRVHPDASAIVGQPASASQRPTSATAQPSQHAQQYISRTITVSAKN